MRRFVYLLLSLVLFAQIYGAETAEEKLVQVFEGMQECVCEKGEENCQCAKEANLAGLRKQKPVIIKKTVLKMKLKKAAEKAKSTQKMLKDINKDIQKETLKAKIIHAKVVNLMKIHKKLHARAIGAKVQIATLKKALQIMDTPKTVLSAKSVQVMIADAGKKTAENKKKLLLLKAKAKIIAKEVVKSPPKKKLLLLGKLKKVYNQMAEVKGKIIAQKSIIKILQTTKAKLVVAEKLKEVKKIKEANFLNKLKVIKKTPKKLPIAKPIIPAKKVIKQKVTAGVIKKSAKKPIIAIKKAAAQFALLEKAEKEVKKVTKALKLAPKGQKPLLEKKLQKAKAKVDTLKPLALKALEESKIQAYTYTKNALKPVKQLKKKLIKYEESIKKSKEFLATAKQKKVPVQRVIKEAIKINVQKKKAQKLAARMKNLNCATRLAGLKVINAKIKLLKHLKNKACKTVLKAKVEIPERKLAIHKQIQKRLAKKLDLIEKKIKAKAVIRHKKVFAVKKQIKEAKLAIANKKVAKGAMQLAIAKKKVAAVMKLIKIKNQLKALKKAAKTANVLQKKKIMSSIKKLDAKAKTVDSKIKLEVKKHKIAEKKLAKEIKQEKAKVKVLKLKAKALIKTLPKARKIAMATTAKIAKLKKKIQTAQLKTRKVLIAKKIFEKKKLGIALKQGKKAEIKKQADISVTKAAKLILSFNSKIIKLNQAIKTAPPTQKAKIAAKIMKLKRQANFVKEKAKEKLATRIIKVNKINKSIRKDIHSITKKPTAPVKPLAKKLVKKVISQEKAKYKKKVAIPQIKAATKKIAILKADKIKAEAAIAKVKVLAASKIAQIEMKKIRFTKIIKKMPVEKKKIALGFLINLDKKIYAVKANAKAEIAKQKAIIKKANKQIKQVKAPVIKLAPKIKVAEQPKAIQKLATKIEKLNQLIKISSPKAKKNYILHKKIAQKQLQLIKMKIEESKAMKKIGNILKKVIALKQSMNKASPEDRVLIDSKIKKLKEQARNIVKKKAESKAKKVINKTAKAKIAEKIIAKQKLGLKKKVANKMQKKWAIAKLKAVNASLAKAKTPVAKEILTKKKINLEKKLKKTQAEGVNIEKMIKGLDYVLLKLKKRSNDMMVLAKDFRKQKSLMTDLDD